MILAQDIRDYLPTDYFRDEQLLFLQEEPGHIHARLSRLTKKGDIIRVKRGLYVFSEKLRRQPLNSFLLANVIYGPSYVSLHSALSYYGLIPEAVYEVTSVNPKRSKEFSTPVGRFSYHRLSNKAFSLGVESKIHHNGHVLIATPEKALLDMLYFYPPSSSAESIYEYLIESLRIEPDDLSSLNHPFLLTLSSYYPQGQLTSSIRHLVESFTKRKSTHGKQKKKKLKAPSSSH